MEHWLCTAAAMHPDRVALAVADGQLSYRELHARALATGAGLERRGVREGDRVGLALPPGADFAATLHGCLMAGAVAVPVDLRLRAGERAARAGGAVAVVVEALDRAPAPQLRAPGPLPLRLEAVATVMHTSGTTSAARPVELSAGNWLAGALGSAVALGLDQDERWLCPLPLVHVGGLSILIRSAIYATTVVLHEGFDPDAVTAMLMDPGQRITLVSLVPTMLARLLDAGLQAPPALRWALLGGGPIAPSLLNRAGAAGVPVAPSYGMTEACSQIATNGWPLPGVDVRIEPDDSEILIRGPNVAAGALAPDGWLHTGDLGTIDPHGRLAIVGRKSDTIVTGGENVAPAEVEAVLLEHPAVADAGVFGRPDPEWGEVVVASVVLRAAVDAPGAELRAFCAERLAPFKLPKAIHFADQLPRSATGKLLRSELD
jgi:O-succinylbenzoic acid--CoA ligase